MMKGKHRLQSLLEETGIGTVRSYSGRGMYGKECLGVDLSRGRSLGSFIGDLIATLGKTNADEMDTTNTVSYAFRSMQTDSMGLGTIVYFPEIEYVSDDEEEDNI